MNLGNNIRKIRELKNFKQESIAKSLNITTQGYSKIERNETDITFSKLIKIAEILEVEISDIINFNEKTYLIQNQSNTNNDKVIICHHYHEKNMIDEKINNLLCRIDVLESFVLPNK
jgi:transcriptional regulator with XRE-family HTH domain